METAIKDLLTTATAQEYFDEKKAFFKKHHNDFTVDTSSMDEYDRWYKDYIFSDGAQWHECYSPVYEDGVALVKGVEIQIKGIKLLRTEYYSTEAGSRYTYEKY